MKIVLMADNRKYDLLVNFCIAYQQMLGKHSLLSVMNVAQLLENNTSLKVDQLNMDVVAGLDQLASLARYDEVDAVFYLREPSDHSYNPADPRAQRYSSANNLFDSCDYNSIPYATNIATAELLILAIDRGDLDWRNLLRP